MDFTVDQLSPSAAGSSTGSRDYVVKRVQDTEREVMKCLALVDGRPSRTLSEILQSLRAASGNATGDLRVDLNNLLIAALAEKTLNDADGSKAVYKVWTYRQINDVDALCGPTIVAHPGSTLLIPFLNLLDRKDLEIRGYPVQDPALSPGQEKINSPHGFDVINLHTHGLNVSPSWPADDVFREIHPFQLKFFIYHLHEDHPVGTFWYHPHKHGAVSTQVAGGMAGALLVQGSDDHLLGLDKLARERNWGEEEPLVHQQITAYQGLPPDNAPAAIQPFTARPDFFALREIIVDHADKVAEIGPMVKWMKENLTSMKPSVKTFVTGQYRPALQTRKTGETYRLRLIHAGIDSNWNFAIRRINGEGEKPDDAAINGQPASDKLLMQVVAWDGMVLENPYMLAPDGKLYLSPGNRADVLVNFGSGTEGHYGIFNDAADKTKSIARFEVETGNGINPTLLTAEDVSANKLFKLPPEMVNAPVTEVNIEYDAKRVLEDQNGAYTLSPGKYWINGSAFPGTPKINRLGQASPLLLRARRHPIHIHVNPALLPADPSRAALGLPTARYWSDTINVPSSNPGFTGIMPFDHFSGKAVVHCHILDHEDNGMMNTFVIRPNQTPVAPLPGVFDITSFSSSALRLLKPAWPAARAQISPPGDMVTVFAFLPRNATTQVCVHCADSVRSIANLRQAANVPPFRILAVTGPNVTGLPELAAALKLDETKDLLCSDPGLRAFQAFALIDGTPMFDPQTGCYTFPTSFDSGGAILHESDVMHGLFVADAKGFVVSSNRGFLAFDDSEQILSEITFAADAEKRIEKGAEIAVPSISATPRQQAAEADAKLNLQRQNIRLREFKDGIR